MPLGGRGGGEIDLKITLNVHDVNMESFGERLQMM